MELNLNEVTLLIDILQEHWHRHYINGSDFSDGPTLDDVILGEAHEMINLYRRLKMAFDRAEARPL